MDIGDFNALPASEAAEVVRVAADIDAWVRLVVAGRPYASVDALVDFASTSAKDWTPDEVAAALADHPRIGEKHDGDGSSAQMSADEQSGVDLADQSVAQRLADGNRLYEQTFDRIFLVRAAGRSAEEILAFLELRLQNDPITELEVTAGELRQIAALRLRGLFT